MKNHRRDKWCIITFDGPGGAGKSTVSRIIAEKLAFFYLDTGAMYRAVALKTKEIGLSPDDVDKIAKLCRELDLVFDSTYHPPRVFLDKKDVSSLIRTPEMDMLSSTISAIPQVRTAMVDLQRKIAKSQRKIVAEGRDMGTVVFPDAKIKFFLTATPEERALRRYTERKAKGEDISFEQVLEELLKRDEQDQNRAVAPLKPAEDSILIDTTGMGIDEVVQKVMTILEESDEVGCSNDGGLS